MAAMSVELMADKMVYSMVAWLVVMTVDLWVDSVVVKSVASSADQ